MVNIKHKLLIQLSAIRQKIRAIPHTSITEKIKYTIIEKRSGYSIIVNNKKVWMKLMRQLHEIYWDWLSQRGIKFSYCKFGNLCTNLWNDIQHVGVFIHYKTVYKRYKVFESKIPRSHAIIRNSQNLDKILLVKHHCGDLWSLPGGKLEENESYGNALLRELYEEVNFVPNKNTIFIGNPKFSGSNACYEIWTLPRSRPRTNSPDEIEEVKWFSLNAMPENTKLLRRYLSMYCITWNDKK